MSQIWDSPSRICLSVTEVHGGMGVLAEYAAERWLREAMILPIWEGTPHRQMLDGLGSDGAQARAPDAVHAPGALCHTDL